MVRRRVLRSNFVNGTGNCDRFGSEIWRGETIRKILATTSPLGIISHVLFFIVIWKKFRSNGSMQILAASCLPTFVYSVYITAVLYLWINSREKIAQRSRRLPCRWNDQCFPPCCHVFSYALLALKRYRDVCQPFGKIWSRSRWLLLFLSAWFLGFLLSFSLIIFRLCNFKYEICLRVGYEVAFWILVPVINS